MRTIRLRPFGFYFATATLAVVSSLEAELTWGARAALVAAAWWIPAVHELGHATLALAFRMKVRRSWAIPGFGRTSLAAGGRRLEFGFVALAGPLAGVAASIAALVVGRASGLGSLLGEAGQQAFEAVAVAGALESLFNLLPVHPLLDGRKAWRVFAEAWRRRQLSRCPIRGSEDEAPEVGPPIATRRQVRACARRRSAGVHSMQPGESAIAERFSARA